MSGSTPTRSRARAARIAQASSLGIEIIRTPVELGEVDGVVLRQRMVGCSDQHLGIADQLDHRVRIVDQRATSANARSACPLRMRPSTFVMIGSLRSSTLMSGQVVRKQSKRGWQQPVAGRLEGADPQHAGVAGSHRIEVGLRRSESGDDVAGVVEQDLACLGERHRSRAARPIDKAMPDGFLERGDLLRDRALRVAEARRGLRERTGLGNGLQRHQVANFDADG